MDHATSLTPRPRLQRLHVHWQQPPSPCSGLPTKATETATPASSGAVASRWMSSSALAFLAWSRSRRRHATDSPEVSVRSAGRTPVASSHCGQKFQWRRLWHRHPGADCARQLRGLFPSAASSSSVPEDIPVPRRQEFLSESKLMQKLRNFRKLFDEKPMRNVAMVGAAAVFFILVGLLQAKAGVTLEAGDAVPLLREGIWNVKERLQQGVAAVASNPHAFPSSSDTLVLLGSIAFVLPAMSRLGLSSSVLAGLMLGIIIGPSGFGIFQNTGWSETLAQIGILFFLCEMGLELNFDRLKKMWRDVFIVGAAQFSMTTAVIYLVAQSLLGLTQVQSFIVGTALSLSSSAFVRQLIDEKKERGTRHGRAAFGILLFQDLVVPFLLVLLPMLPHVRPGYDQSLFTIRQAVLRTGLALGIAAINGRLFLNWLFSFVAEAQSPVALRSLSFLAIFGTCYVFEAFGLPSTLGAFLSGVLLSETAYRQQVETVISPIREDFFTVFFIVVGCSIDVQLVFSHPLLVLSTVAVLLLTKSVVTGLVCYGAGLSVANSLQIGLLLSQSGEFSFVMISTALSLGEFSGIQSKLLVTVVALSLASTPLFAAVGRNLAQFLEQKLEERVPEAEHRPRQVEAADVVICGYGRIGRMITQVLDARLVRWVAYDTNPRVVNEARRLDLPVFYGDILQMEKNMVDDGVRMIVMTLNEKRATRMARLLKKKHPDVKVLACVTTLSDSKGFGMNGIIPIMPTLPEDSMLLNLPIGIAVFDKLGYSEEEIGSLVRDKRLQLIREEEERRKAFMDSQEFHESPAFPA